MLRTTITIILLCTGLASCSPFQMEQVSELCRIYGCNDDSNWLIFTQQDKKAAWYYHMSTDERQTALQIGTDLCRERLSAAGTATLYAIKIVDSGSGRQHIHTCEALLKSQRQ